MRESLSGGKTIELMFAVALAAALARLLAARWQVADDRLEHAAAPRRLLVELFVGEAGERAVTQTVRADLHPGGPEL